MTIYLSGPISKYKDVSKAKDVFDEYELQVRLLGHKAINPFNIQPVDHRNEWAYHLRADLAALCSRSHAILALPGALLSRGARLELFVAWALGITIYWHIEDVPTAI